MARINTGDGWTGSSILSVIFQGKWTWTTKTGDAATAGQVGVNTTTWATVTQVNVNQQTADNMDATNAFAKLGVGEGIYLQHATDATRWGRYDLTGPPTDNGTWWSFPVELNELGSAGAVPAGNTNTVVRLVGQL